jgi:hypothetical protein
MWLLAKEILKNIFIHAGMICIFFRIALALKRQKNALRILLCIPGRNNVLLLFRGTTRIEKNNTTKHS